MITFTKYLSYIFYRGFMVEVTFQMIFLSSLIALFAWYIFRQPTTKEKCLSRIEEEKLIAEFDPEELVPDNTLDPLASRKRVVTSTPGKYITVDGHPCLNLATHNYLCLVEDPLVQLNASASIGKYGVGSCGPRGFYGTVDVHLELEEKLAKFMEVEEACVYSYAFATMASAIPAYCKRGDIIFVDQAVNFSIQKGLDASRSNIFYYKHNDMSDLKNLLMEQEKVDLKNPKKAARTRKFLIAEGIFMNTGQICNLPELVRLRKEFKLRMLLDESVSFGTLGDTGKGVVEYFNIPNIEVDLRIGSMEGSLASIGGFCCGTSFIVEHQRLSGLGYCFSASLPPVLAVAALTSLEHMKEKPELFRSLKNISCMLHNSLSELPDFSLGGDADSPIKYLYLKREIDYSSERKILNNIVDYCIEKGVAIAVPQYLTNVEKFPVRPRLRITSNVSLTKKDVEVACSALRDACVYHIPTEVSSTVNCAKLYI